MALREQMSHRGNHNPDNSFRIGMSDKEKQLNRLKMQKLYQDVVSQDQANGPPGGFQFDQEI